MDLSGLVIVVAVGVLAWRESKASSFRDAASTAVLLCMEEIERLRGAAMADISEEAWRREGWERSRGEILTALDRFYIARNGEANYDQALIHKSIPSFQNEADWQKWKTLARGPYGSH